jgi:hypothetical protein
MGMEKFIKNEVAEGEKNFSIFQKSVDRSIYDMNSAILDRPHNCTIRKVHLPEEKTVCISMQSMKKFTVICVTVFVSTPWTPLTRLLLEVRFAPYFSPG